MARSNIYIVLVAFFFTTALASLNSPEKRFLHDCISIIGDECGNQFFSKLFTRDKITISRDCCYKVIQMGYSCHVKMAVFFLETDPVLRNADRIEYLSKSDHIYEKCDRVTQPEDSKFLAKCVQKIGSDCGEQIVAKLFTDVGSVNRQCCENLMKMGEKCHMNMAKALIRTPAMRSIDAPDFLRKNKKLFDDCKDME
ncbi:putative Prolamin-like domain-containing protein [Medicago truncatula]|uniref:ECA1 gametogenesis related family n=2 Tax=Medicago truncatula TaxID=3880 RepID=A0A072TRD6_MEDTR|nr:ECA1 gametogenesis related family [Medicago truncatula]RHN41328.1 putative Prolamin-like domain-containing protein [Medicago truncatula]